MFSFTLLSLLQSRLCLCFYLCKSHLWIWPLRPLFCEQLPGLCGCPPFTATAGLASCSSHPPSWSSHFHSRFRQGGTTKLLLSWHRCSSSLPLDAPGLDFLSPFHPSVHSIIPCVHSSQSPVPVQIPYPHLLSVSAVLGSLSV